MPITNQYPIVQTPISRAGKYPGLERLKSIIPTPLYQWLDSFRTQVANDHTLQSQYSLQKQLVGLDANLPAAGNPGRTYFATDSLKLYVDSGSAWHFVTLT